MSDESTPVFEPETGFLLDKLPLLWQNLLTIFEKRGYHE